MSIPFLVMLAMALSATCWLCPASATKSAERSSLMPDENWLILGSSQQPGGAHAFHRHLLAVNYSQIAESLTTCSNTQELSSSYIEDYLPVCKLAPASTCGSIPSSIYPYGACCPTSANLTSGVDCVYQGMPYDPYFKCPANLQRVCCTAFYCTRYSVSSYFQSVEATCPGDLPDAFCCNSTSLSVSRCPGSLNGTTASCKGTSGTSQLRCCPKGVREIITASVSNFSARLQGNTTATPAEIAGFTSCNK